MIRTRPSWFEPGRASHVSVWGVLKIRSQLLIVFAAMPIRPIGFDEPEANAMQYGRRRIVWMVGVTGIEPVTPAMSMQCSPAETETNVS